MKKEYVFLTNKTGFVEYADQQKLKQEQLRQRLEGVTLVCIEQESYSDLVMQQSKGESRTNSTKEISTNEATIVRRDADGTEYYSMPSYSEFLINSIK